MKDDTDEQMPNTDPPEVHTARREAPPAHPDAASAELLASAVAERDRLEEQLKRALADLQNVRRRQAKEADEARRRAVEGMAMELLPVLDNYERALAAHEQQNTAAKAEARAMLDGLRMVRSLLAGVLERHGLAEMPVVGKPFDPLQHEAVGVEASEGIAPGHVVRVMQRGYTMGDRVLRPAKVMVAAERRPATTTEADEGQP